MSLNTTNNIAGGIGISNGDDSTGDENDRPYFNMGSSLISTRPPSAHKQYRPQIKPITTVTGAAFDRGATNNPQMKHRFLREKRKNNKTSIENSCTQSTIVNLE